MAEYSEAAEGLARCGRMFPADARGRAAFEDAVVLQLGLGNEAEALGLANEYVKTYGATDRARVATVVFAIAAHQVEKERWREAVDVLSRNQRLIDYAPVDVRIQAHLVAARGLLHGPTPEVAYVHLTAMRTLYGTGAEMEPLLAKAYPAEEQGQRDRRLAKALTAVGDSIVMLADREREKLLPSLRPPVYSGPRTTDAVHRHITTTAAEWMTRRRAAIEELSRQYIAVLDMRPVPPPKAVVAASGAVGKMWADYADDLARMVPTDVYPTTRAAGTPATMPTRAEARGAVDEVRAPILRRQAIPAMRKCVDLAVKYQYTDEHSQACEAWLVKNDPETRERSTLAPQPRQRQPEWIREEPRPTTTTTSTSTSTATATATSTSTSP